jgi:hypothetical protein
MTLTVGFKASPLDKGMLLDFAHAMVQAPIVGLLTRWRRDQ